MQERAFNFKPSKYYLILLTIILLTSMAIAGSLPMRMEFRLLGWMFVFVYGGMMIWRYGLLRSKHSILSLSYQSDGRWHLHTKNAVYVAQLRGDSTVTHLVAILRFQVTNQYWPQSCLVFRDSLERDEYRRLLVVLRMY